MSARVAVRKRGKVVALETSWAGKGIAHLCAVQLLSSTMMMAGVCCLRT